MYSYDRRAAIYPVGPLKRTDSHRYNPALLWGKDLLEDAKKLSDAAEQGKPEDPRLLKQIEADMVGLAESFGWAITIHRHT